MRAVTTVYAGRLRALAARIHLTITNERKLYDEQFTPVISKVAALFPQGKDYDPNKAANLYVRPAVISIGWYLNTHEPNLHVIRQVQLRSYVARMLERKYRQQALMESGLEAHKAILSFPGDAELDDPVEEQ